MIKLIIKNAKCKGTILNTFSAIHCIAMTCSVIELRMASNSKQPYSPPAGVTGMSSHGGLTHYASEELY